MTTKQSDPYIKKQEARQMVLLKVSVLAMCGLGVIAMLTAQATSGNLRGSWDDPTKATIELAVAFVIAILPGFIAAVFVAWNLKNKKTSHALLCVFAPSVLWVILYTNLQVVFWIWPLDSALAAVLGVIALSYATKELLPDLTGLPQDETPK